jgi:hypothetical protein
MHRELQMPEHCLIAMKGFESVTKALQEDSISILDIRILFYEILQDYPSMKSDLHQTSQVLIYLFVIKSIADLLCSRRVSNASSLFISFISWFHHSVYFLHAIILCVSSF